MINERTKQLRLGRRLLLIENIGFSERFKLLQILTYILQLILTTGSNVLITNTDTKILMNSPA